MDDELRIISIDPGSLNLGYVEAVVNTRMFDIISIDTHNLEIDKLPSFYKDGILPQIPLEERLLKLNQWMLVRFNGFNPDHLCVETNYYDLRHPTAFQVLIKVLLNIKKTFSDYRLHGGYYTYSPMEIKSHLGVSRKDGKDGMSLKLSQCEEIKNPLKKHFGLLSEHEIDALALLLLHIHRIQQNPWEVLHG